MAIEPYHSAGLGVVPFPYKSGLYSMWELVRLRMIERQNTNRKNRIMNGRWTYLTLLP